jgi:hypothetical protein
VQKQQQSQEEERWEQAAQDEFGVQAQEVQIGDLGEKKGRETEIIDKGGDGLGMLRFKEVYLPAEYPQEDDDQDGE